MTIATTSEMMLFVTEIAVPVSPSTFDAPPFETASRILSTMWYFVCEEAEPAAALRQVVDVPGKRLDEVVHLMDERRDEEEADARRSPRSRGRR